MKGDGLAAEHLAAEFLQQQGLRLLEKNYRSRFGEIDLILQESNVIVFVEVRLRSNPDFGGAAASITTAKQARLVRTAQTYLQREQCHAGCRFDVVLLQGLKSEPQWIKNAFEAE